MNQSRRVIIAAVLLLSLAIAACGSSAPPTSTPAPSATPQPTPAFMLDTPFAKCSGAHALTPDGKNWILATCRFTPASCLYINGQSQCFALGEPSHDQIRMFQRAYVYFLMDGVDLSSYDGQCLQATGWLAYSDGKPMLMPRDSSDFQPCP